MRSLGLIWIVARIELCGTRRSEASDVIGIGIWRCPLAAARCNCRALATRSSAKPNRLEIYMSYM